MLAEGEQAEGDDGVGGDGREEQQHVEALAEVGQQDEAGEEERLGGGGREEEGAVGALRAVDAVERGASRRSFSQSSWQTSVSEVERPGRDAEGRLGISAKVCGRARRR